MISTFIDITKKSELQVRFTEAEIQARQAYDFRLAKKPDHKVLLLSIESVTGHIEKEIRHINI